MNDMFNHLHFKIFFLDNLISSPQFTEVANDKCSRRAD